MRRELETHAGEMAPQGRGADHEPGHDHGGEFKHHHHVHLPHDGAKHEHGHHLLQVEHLSIGFDMYRKAGLLSSERMFSKVIDDLSIAVHVGEIVAIVGASGSGKTLLADAIMGLYEPNARVSGTIYFDGVLQTAASLVGHRGREIAFVPQSTFTPG